MYFFEKSCPMPHKTKRFAMSYFLLHIIHGQIPSLKNNNDLQEIIFWYKPFI